MPISNDPFEEGKLAAANNKPVSDNPYPEASEDHALWTEGHDSYTGSDEDGEPKDDA